MVKDHRTDFETSNTAAVLNGDLDPFIESYLRQYPYSATMPDAAGTAGGETGPRQAESEARS
jgi:hypothetical protein